MVGSTLSMSASRIYGAVMSGVQGIYIAHLLGPQLFGVFNLIYLIGWYVSLVHLGSRDVAYRDIPFYRGRNDSAREKLTRDVSVSTEILWRGFSSLALAVAALCLKDPMMRAGLLLWAVSMFVARLSELYSVLTTVEQDFVFVSWVNAIKLTVVFAIIVLTTPWFGIYGVLLGPTIGGALSVCILSRRHPLAFSFSLDRMQFLRMLRAGLPLAVLTFVSWVYVNADRSIVAWVLPRIELGYYTAAAFMVQFLTQLPGDFVTVLQPKLYRELGKENRLADIKGLVVHTTRAYVYLSALAILMLWTWFPPLIHLLLPKYEPSIPVLRILSLTIFFSSLLVVPYTILYSPGINRQLLCVGVWGGSALLTAGSGYGLLRLGYGLSGIAVASVLGQAMAAAAFLFLTRHYYCEWMDQKWHFYLELLAPIGYVGCILGLLGYFGLHASSVPALLGESVLLVVVYLPCLLLFNRKAGLVNWKSLRGLVNGSQA